VLLVMLFSGYLFLGFSRSTRKTLHAIQEAAERVAVGDFPNTCAWTAATSCAESRKSLEAAVTTLRGFETAQRNLFDAHERGEIDERLQTEAFPGRSRAWRKRSMPS
jgi:hypothetical protein